MAEKIVLHFDTDPVLFRVIREAIRGAVVAWGATDSEAQDIQIAVGETLSNAYLHGYEKKPGPVDVELQRSTSGVTVTVTNYGKPPTNALVVPRATRHDGGNGTRGLFLVGAMMDSAVASALDHQKRGVVVTMVKYFRQ